MSTSIIPITATPVPNTAISPFSGPAAFDAAQRMALALSASTLVPDAYRGPDKVGNVLIALEMAQRIGCTFMTVVQNLHIISGRPSLSASFLIATVNSSGRFTPLRFEFSGEAGSDSRGCRASARDKATQEPCPGTVVTVKMAKEQGWYSRGGSKWPSMTDQMLQYRAAAFWSRIYCPELGLGMMTREELEDTPVEKAKPEIRVKAEPEPAAAVVKEPTVVASVEPAPQVTPTAAVNPAVELRRKVKSEFTRVGITWPVVQSLAVAGEWWEGAATTEFKNLSVEALTYLSTRADRIKTLVDNETTTSDPVAEAKAVAEPTPATDA
jgi:hypothetical protein